MQSYIDKSADYFAHARKEIVPLLPPQCGRVLEIGCGSGATLGWLRRDHRASSTVGVEISEAAAQCARAHADEVHCLDFERVELPVANSRFDVILCLDVLEHMVNPWLVIDRLVSRYLAPGGTLIVSLPNVRHYSVVLPLLFQGRWDYQDAGLLDRTHLRFFTRDTAVGLLSHSLLGAVHCTATGFDWPSRKGIFNTLTAGVFREFLTYQYFLAVHKKD
ncbi:Methyltransferase domain-containing protein [Polaromonas sp. OV174]|uniref:class I SAM-dependent methyltransferase n=1 Tax=Polaromonas sp. OV174 TaxID=1855300 RepID=UPI0008ED00DE|nr:class I SAM-dependent methyltransferase [Polaromonas sp. OV174]SFB66784.1 Methyltransferase domain-containing protein [Polaromonas sp. OV174]